MRGRAGARAVVGALGVSGCAPVGPAAAEKNYFILTSGACGRASSRIEADDDQELGEGRRLRHYLELAASGLEAHLASVGLWLCSSSETLVRDISHASI